jgi:hypothetical protein
MKKSQQSINQTNKPDFQSHLFYHHHLLETTTLMISSSPKKFEGFQLVNLMMEGIPFVCVSSRATVIFILEIE